MEALLQDDKPAYIRVGRNPVEDIYTPDSMKFELDQAVTLCEGDDLAIIACGEMVKPAVEAAKLLAAEGISVQVLDLYCVKPLDRDAVLNSARKVKALDHG